jgi:RHS repeat-associated protein
VQTCTSEPFGDSYLCTGTEPARFAGYFVDSESGLDNAPARYYSPSLGRFMTPDPLSDAVPGTLAGAEPVGTGYSMSALWPEVTSARNAAVADPQAWDAYSYTTNNPATKTDPAGLCGSGDPFLPGGGGGCDPFFDPSCACGPGNFGPFCAGCDPLTGFCQPGLLKGSLPLPLPLGGASPCIAGVSHSKVTQVNLCNAGDTFIVEWDCPGGCPLGDCKAGQDNFQLQCDKRGPAFYALCSTITVFAGKEPFCDCCLQKKR